MTQQTKILQATIGTIIGVVVVGAIFGAVWPPGVGLTALVALIALFVILSKGAEAMNEAGNFGQGLTSVLAAVFLLPAAIAAATFLGVTVGVADAINDPFTEDPSYSEDSSYEECLADPDTTFEECEELG
jgi:hypothetical protein